MIGQQDWRYPYECPQCLEPLPLQKEGDKYVGWCQWCHLDIDILEEDYLEWKEQQELGLLTPQQEDLISDDYYNDRLEEYNDEGESPDER